VIQITDTHSFAQANAAKLGPNHGYRIEGDIALLHADVVADTVSAPRSQWALQLWACESPFSGGTLQGVKIAEAALPLADAADTQRLDAEALASLPGGQRDYSMVLVLASGSNGAFDQIHDFANYPARERFITPHLEGSVGYQVDGVEVVLRAESVRNPRRADNLSGSLALELWAVTEMYHGGPVDGGSLLASADVGRIAGETEITFEQRVKFDPPAAGRHDVVLMLREWVPGGFVTRDFCTFAQQYVVAEPRIEARKYGLHEINGTNGVNGSASSQPLAKAAPAVVVERSIAVGEPAEAVELPVAAVKPVAVELPVAAVKPVAAVERPVAAAQPAAAVERPVVAQPAAAVIEHSAAAAHLAAAIERPAAAQPVAAVTPAAAPSVAKNATTAPSQADDRVSIMLSTVEEIAQLKGLTRKIAIEIVKGRPYASVDELTRVRGIGPKLLAKLRGDISL
jgi:DNA uptake protein ComE-like DNA-binding protein